MVDAPLPTTRLTLLTQLRQDPSDQAGWEEFVERYGRHIYRWCRQWKLQDADAEDVTQDILVKLTQKLRAFAYDPSRSFRGWLKTVAHHACKDFNDSRHARRAGGDGRVQGRFAGLQLLRRRLHGRLAERPGGDDDGVGHGAPGGRDEG